MEKNIIVKNYRRSAIILTFIIWALYFCRQDATIAQEIVTISINDLQQHMDFIASDATEDRFTGSPGYRKRMIRWLLRRLLATVLTNRTWDGMTMQV